MNYKIFKTDLKPWLKKFFFDKFSYIIKSITGTIITITDGIRKKVNELKMSKLSTQDGTPSPDNPVEVNTVKGYRNLFDISNIKSINGGGTWNNNEYSLFGITFTINNDGSIKINGTSTNDAYINLYSSTTSNLINDSNKTYNFSKGINNTNISLAIYEYISTWSTKANTTDKSVQYTPSGNQTGQIFRITIGNNKTINNVTIYPMLTEGTEALPYVPYGNNYVYTKIVGKNLFDKDNANIINAYINTTNSTIVSNSNARTVYIGCKPNTTYTISRKAGQRFVVLSTKELPANGVIGTNRVYDNTGSQLTITTGEEDEYLAVFYYLSSVDTLTEEEIRSSIMIEQGTQATSYEPYKESIVTIPLNGNEIAGIGDYKDEPIVDKNGHCWLNKKVGKAIFDGSESGWSKASSTTMVDRYVLNTNLYLNNSNSKCNYFIKGGINQNLYIWFNNNGVQLGFNFASYGTTTLEQWKEWLSTHNLILYQPLATPDPIDLNYTVDIRLFNGVNNISNSDDMDMSIKYYSK